MKVFKAFVVGTGLWYYLKDVDYQNGFIAGKTIDDKNVQLPIIHTALEEMEITVAQNYVMEKKKLRPALLDFTP